jgi:hypothetical protein
LSKDKKAAGRQAAKRFREQGDDVVKAYLKLAEQVSESERSYLFGFFLTQAHFEDDPVLPTHFLCAANQTSEWLCDLWQLGTGERLPQLTPVQRSGILVWLWENHDRRALTQTLPSPLHSEWTSANRIVGWRAPEKSPDHDRPWSGARKWSPRRWFPHPKHSAEWGDPLQISIAGARRHETALALQVPDYNLQRRLDMLDRWQEATAPGPLPDIGDPPARHLAWKRLSEAPRFDETLHSATPPGQPGAWSLRYIEAPAAALSVRLSDTARLGGCLFDYYRALPDGRPSGRIRTRRRLPDDDDLDRLATSAALEVT